MLARRRAAAPRDRQRGQGGATLMIVLAVWGVAGLAIAALMSLLFTTINVAGMSERSGKELRALDSAIETAINQMRFDPASTGRDACGLEPPVQLVEELVVRNGSGDGSGDIVVEIDCDGSVDSERQSRSDQVRLVNAQGYTGDVPWTTASLWPSGVDVPALTGSSPSLVHRGRSPLQFGAGLTARTTSAVVRTEGAGPAATGPAVEVAGDYTQGSPGPGATDTNRCGVLGQQGPMEIVALAGAGSPQCDVPAADLKLDDNPTGAEAGFRVPTERVPQLLESCPTPVITFEPGVYDNNPTFTRLNRQLGSFNPIAGCAGPRTFHFKPGVYYFNGSNTNAGNVFGINRPDAFIVAGEPKGWDPAEGVQNSPLANDPQAQLCDPEQSGVTFVLPPQMRFRHTAGRFDMCAAFSEFEGQPPLPAIYQQTSFPTRVEREPWSRQFGSCLATPGLSTGAPPLATLPNQFDVLDSGSSARPGNNTWADHQKLPAVPSSECRIGRSHRVDVTDLGPEPVSSAYLYVRGKEFFPANLITDRRVMVTVREGSAPGNRICTTAAKPGLSNGDWMIRVDLLTASCANPRSNFTDDPRTSLISVGTPYLAVEQQLNRTRLANARIEITPYITLKTQLFGSPVFPSQNYRIDDVQLVVNNVAASLDGPVATPDPAPDPTLPRGFHDAGAVLAPSGLARPRMPNNRWMTSPTSWASSGDECPYLLCPVSTSTRLPNRQTFDHRIDLGELEIQTPPAYVNLGIDPRVSSLKLRAQLDPAYCGESVDPCALLAPLFSESGLDLDDLIQQSYTGSAFTARVELETVGGTVCGEFAGSIGQAQEITLDLMDSRFRTSDGDCGQNISSFSDLRLSELPAANGVHRVRATMVLRTECFRVASSCWRGRDGSDHLVWQLRPPAIQQIALDVATDTYAAETTTSRVRVDARATAPRSSFNVEGRVLMPRSNLDIIWDGDVTEGRPLVTDELVAGALGSHINAAPTRNLSEFGAVDRYLVCCQPRQSTTRNVRLFAETGQRRVQADVVFTDVIRGDDGDIVAYSPGHQVDILDWQVCDEGRCS